MHAAAHIGPDSFLSLEFREHVDRAEALQAWEQAYAQLASALRQRHGTGVLHVVCGLQGAGKSTWIAAQLLTSSPNDVYFDGALPSRRHRTRAITMAKSEACKVIGVLIDTPLSVALARNARRRGAARIAEATVHHVFGQLEPPTTDEGFDEIHLVRSPDM